MAAKAGVLSVRNNKSVSQKAGKSESKKLHFSFGLYRPADIRTFSIHPEHFIIYINIIITSYFFMWQMIAQ
jgi:hypothetical protein